jgi:biotin operon repressor
MEGDWSDLTPKQIGEVLGTSGRSVTAQITKIRHRTGYDVPYRRNSRGRRQKSD